MAASASRRRRPETGSQDPDWFLLRHRDLVALPTLALASQLDGAVRFLIQRHIMNIHLFQVLADQLLRTHFGIDIRDTNLTEEEAVEAWIAGGQRPHNAVDEHAEAYELYRTDQPNTCWGLCTTPLTELEELKAMQALEPQITLTEDVMCCPKCGSRTEFKDVVGMEIGMQHHCCPNNSCGHEFLAEPVSSMYAESIIHGQPENYNGIVVHGVVNRNPKDSEQGTAYEIAGQDDFPEMFAVYLIVATTANTGQIEVVPVGDFGIPEQAHAYASKLHHQYGWPVQLETASTVRESLAA